MSVRRPIRLTGRSKFHVRTDAAGKRTRTIDGHLFASLAEARRYGELTLLVKAHRIDSLELQPVFQLGAWQRGIFHRIGKYVADFRYLESGTSRQIVEDVKGVLTPLGRWKIAHVEAQYGITIRIIR